MSPRLSWIFTTLRDHLDRRYALLVLLNGLAAIVQSPYRVTSYRTDLLLPLLIWTFGSLTSLLFVKKVTRRVLSPGLRAKMMILEHALVSVQLLLVFCCVLVYLNGDLGQAASVEHQTRIRRIEQSRLPFGSVLPLTVAHLEAWTDSKKTLRLPLTAYEEGNLWGGEVVRVKVHVGYFEVPWVSSVERDEEYYLNEVIRAIPTAAESWKKLMDYYRARKRWVEVYSTVQGYLKVYPKDYRIAAIIGHQLVTEGFYDQTIELLRYATAGRPTYSDYQALGWALQAKGRTAEGVTFFEASIPLAPDDWEAYFHLGEAYAALGRRKDAIAMYEKVLERRPDFPEIQGVLKQLKQQSS